MQIGVCDDRQEMRDFIIEKVKKIYPAEDIRGYGSGRELLDAPRFPDILLLDIQMPDMDGLETARQLRRSNWKMIIIFVTVSEDYVFQSFDVGAFHYLVKPFNDGKFAEVLQNAVRLLQERNREDTVTKKVTPRLMINAKGEHITVPWEDIIYAEVFNRKIIIHTTDSDIEYYGKMKELEKLAGDDFFRPHRAYLINLNYVRKYDSSAIYLKKGQAFMAKQNYPDFVKCYLRFNRKKGKE